MTYLYSLIFYDKLCSSRKIQKENYKYLSGIHRHHILPTHSGGLDTDDNFTYLTVREHIIAHYLLWRIHRNPNDLRAMHMLGANLTVNQRIIVGNYCRDNKIGFHSKEYDLIRNEWQQKGIDSQRKSKSKNTFYYWSTKEGQKERASLGGKASLESGNNIQWIYWMSPEGQKERASLGGKAHKGKKCMYKPGDISFKRVNPEDIQKYLNDGYIFGSPIIGKNQHTKASS